MKSKQSFKLIDGKFTTAEAKEILLNVFTSKIHFHQARSFMSKECYGTEDEIAMKRIPQLRRSVEKIQALFAEAGEEGGVVVLKSQVSIVISAPKKQATKVKVPAKATAKKSTPAKPRATKKLVKVKAA